MEEIKNLKPFYKNGTDNIGNDFLKPCLKNCVMWRRGTLGFSSSALKTWAGSFTNILENCKDHNIDHLIYASSSSVYGESSEVPFNVNQNVDYPISLYAATKKSNELMAHSYSHLYGIPSTALRFFTVYGPWGRPDMAPMIFTKAILSGKPIDIFNFGNMKRDFTYIDDVISTLLKLIYKPATSDPKFNHEVPNPSTSWACHRIFNLGSNNPISLNTFIDLLENEIGIKELVVNVS